MRKLIAAAALALISTSAHAEVHNIEFGGHAFRIEVPKNCKEISCIRLSAPEKPTGKAKKTTQTIPAAPAPTAAPVASSAAPAVAPSVATVPRESAKVVTPQPSAQPIYGSPRNEAETLVDERKPVGRLSPPVAEESQLSVFDPNERKPEPANSEDASPVGLWLTQKGEGKIRIEPCGDALCGYVEGKPSEKVLINMKPAQNNRWHGKIHDIRGGGTYMANISLKGANSLRVEGCAFGGLFCGGETWSRAQ
jgi:uncharacterized protein (DUF2147 family)